MNLQSITLGGGCFWCLEAVYELVDGVTAVESGYANGHVSAPTYEQVCGGDTGHVEVVKVTFDADRIPLREVLEIFFTIHDPTTLNRQGNDIGPQYRSDIYWTDPAHEAVAREVRAEADAANRGRVVTELLALDNYWRAEDYHQHYFANHPGQGYCAFVVAPKVEKFRKTFRSRVRAAA
jgi:peptide-methionine (S)-S-oxide reductase